MLTADLAGLSIRADLFKKLVEQGRTDFHNVSIVGKVEKIKLPNPDKKLDLTGANLEKAEFADFGIYKQIETLKDAKLSYKQQVQLKAVGGNEKTLPEDLKKTIDFSLVEMPKQVSNQGSALPKMISDINKFTTIRIHEIKTCAYELGSGEVPTNTKSIDFIEELEETRVELGKKLKGYLDLETSTPGSVLKKKQNVSNVTASIQNFKQFVTLCKWVTAHGGAEALATMSKDEFDALMNKARNKNRFEFFGARHSGALANIDPGVIEQFKAGINALKQKLESAPSQQEPPSPR